MATDRTFPYPITGLFDGARWPRSHEPRSEPPSLIAALRGRVGPILPVSVERTARNTVPHRVTVDGQVVRINRFSSSVHTIGVGDGHQDRFLLLVVPPRTRPAAARTAMASAAAPGNSTLAPWILTAASLGPAAEGAPPPAPPGATAQRIGRRPGRRHGRSRCRPGRSHCRPGHSPAADRGAAGCAQSATCARPGPPAEASAQILGAASSGPRRSRSTATSAAAAPK
ncbi:hypothetical protein GCM10025734_03470 [Kitasatospora paranensis]|uniref:DUF5994 family protein n=1 Tax=Kitasatospora paranensis TaxID=258053 RepID=UPI00337B62ED